MTRPIQTILLVDDDPDDRFLFKEALDQIDNSLFLTTAIDGIDALDQLKNGLTPDLIFMDVNMPRMNGIDCLDAIKKSETLSAIPVLMYSTSTHYKKECLAIGAADYIEKPDEFGKLCHLLQTIFAREAKQTSGKS